jgi:hypothetical protein
VRALAPGRNYTIAAREAEEGLTQESSTASVAPPCLASHSACSLGTSVPQLFNCETLLGEGARFAKTVPQLNNSGNMAGPGSSGGTKARRWCRAVMR